MPLFNLKGLGKFYITKVKCRNCGHIGELRVPKGTTVIDHVTSGNGKCTNCGCNELNAQSTPATQAHVKNRPVNQPVQEPAYTELPPQQPEGFGW